MIFEQYEQLAKKINSLSEQDRTAILFLIQNIDIADSLSMGEKMSEEELKHLIKMAEEKDDSILKILVMYKYFHDYGSAVL